ncbi:MAG: DUF1302 family protein, partial [Panacagrimonas sp.]
MGFEGRGGNFVRGRGVASAVIGSLLAAASGSAAAGSFEFLDGIEGEYKIISSYAVAMRTRNPHHALIDGEVDPLQPEVLPMGQLVGFTHTGLPKTINTDDGNRNFRKGSLINNRVSALGEFKLRWNDYGAVFS